MSDGLKIAITGKMRSGKDTFAQHFIGDDYFYPIKFSKGISEIIDNYLPEVSLQPKNRKAYQTIGQSMREIDPLVWVKYSVSAAPENESLIVTDLRQDNEAKYLRDKGFIIIKVESDEDIRIRRIIESGDTFSINELNHETELSVDKIVADYTVKNNGSEHDLMVAAKRIKRKLKLN